MNEPFIPVQRTAQCIKCGDNTSQHLIKVEEGVSWQCKECENTEHAYSYNEMVELVSKHLFNLPAKNQNQFEDPDYRVFIKHHGPEAEEKEVSIATLKQHLKLTGTKPEVGKPLFGRSSNAPVPFGEVVRIEKK
jgi:ribosomal protein L37AE/L43A